MRKRMVKENIKVKVYFLNIWKFIKILNYDEILIIDIKFYFYVMFEVLGLIGVLRYVLLIWGELKRNIFKEKKKEIFFFCIFIFVCSCVGDYNMYFLFFL